MSDDTDRMDAAEFAAWMGPARAIGAIERAIASRDAYRERQALEAAAERAAKAWSKRYSDRDLWEGVRAAILSEPRFVKGQLVVDGRTGKMWVWEDSMNDSTAPNRYWAPKAHMDAEGRVIVEEA